MKAVALCHVFCTKIKASSTLDATNFSVVNLVVSVFVGVCGTIEIYILAGLTDVNTKLKELPTRQLTVLLTSWFQSLLVSVARLRYTFLQV